MKLNFVSLIFASALCLNASTTITLPSASDWAYMDTATCTDNLSACGGFTDYISQQGYEIPYTFVPGATTVVGDDTVTLNLTYTPTTGEWDLAQEPFLLSIPTSLFGETVSEVDWLITTSTGQGFSGGTIDCFYQGSYTCGMMTSLNTNGSFQADGLVATVPMNVSISMLLVPGSDGTPGDIVAASSVPEPGTWGLFLTAFLLMGVAVIRRRTVPSPLPGSRSVQVA